MLFSLIKVWTTSDIKIFRSVYISLCFLILFFIGGEFKGNKGAGSLNNSFVIQSLSSVWVSAIVQDSKVERWEVTFMFI